MFPSRLAPDARVVMLSGATRGIGRATAERLLQDGFRLSLGVLRVQPTTQMFPEALVHRFDARQPETAETWIAATVERFGRIDALINNAGILLPFSLGDGMIGALQEHWEINTVAPFRLIQLAMPYLEQSGHGRIVNIASTDGKRVREGSSVAYAMTKHAVLALTHAARFAGWHKGVRATALCPGAVDTDLIADFPGVTPKAERLQPATIAETISFLLGLPNTASVAELVMNTRLESGL